MNATRQRHALVGFLSLVLAANAAPSDRPLATKPPVLAAGVEMRGRANETEQRWLGLKFSPLRPPLAIRSCVRDEGMLGREIYIEASQVLVLRSYRCAGRQQYWLMRPVDRSGNRLSVQKFNSNLTHLEDVNWYSIEDIFVLPQLPKKYKHFGQACYQNDQSIEELQPFAFATGTTVPNYDYNPNGGRGPVIGYKSTSIIAAWKVNVRQGKFESMPFQGLYCDFSDV